MEGGGFIKPLPKPKSKRYESFVIAAVDSDGSMQGITVDGKIREFSLVVTRDLATNELALSVARHFTDAASIPHFEDSEAWTSEEQFGDED